MKALFILFILIALTGLGEQGVSYKDSVNNKINITSR